MDPIAIVVLLVVLPCVAYTSYKIGINKGTELTVQNLVDVGIISIREEDSDS